MDRVLLMRASLERGLEEGDQLKPHARPDSYEDGAKSFACAGTDCRRSLKLKILLSSLVSR